MDDDDYPDVDMPDFRLKEGLDVAGLQSEEGQLFEVDMDDMQQYDDHGPFTNDAYKYYEQDFMHDEFYGAEDEKKTDKGEQLDFNVIATKMTNVTDDGGVKKQILVQGIGEVIPEDANVTIHYNAYLEYADEPYDSTYMRQKPHHFNLGHGMVIPGLDIAVKSMRKKERSRFLMNPEYGFGDRGCPPRIPGSAQLLFVVELLNYAEAGGAEHFNCKSKEERREAPFSDVMKAVKDQRRQGKENFKAKNFLQAQKAYQRAVQYLEDYHLKDEEEEEEQQKVLLTLYCNLALANLNQQKYSATVKNSNDALKINGNDPKPHYYKGKALRLQGYFDQALVELNKAKALKPNDPDIAKELKLLDREKQRFQEVERDMYAKMFETKDSSSEAVAAKPRTTPVKSPSGADKVNQDFKKIAREMLIKVKEDPTFTVVPYSTNMYTVEELGIVEDVARELGLYVTEQQKQDNSLLIRVCKKKPEVETVLKH